MAWYLTQCPYSPRFIELRKLIPVQERLVRAKLDGNAIFDRLGTLKVTPHEERVALPGCPADINLIHHRQGQIRCHLLSYT